MKTNKDALIDIAFRLFLSKGYEQCSMMDLARAAGLSKGAFHYYFPRKSDLLDACLERFFTEAMTTPSAPVRGPKGFAESYAGRYGALLAGLVEMGVPLAAYQAFLWTMQRDGLIDTAQMSARIRSEAVAAFEAGRAAGTWSGKSDEAAGALLAAIEGAGNLAALLEAPTPEAIKALFDEVLDGLAPLLQSS